MDRVADTANRVGGKDGGSMTSEAPPMRTNAAFNKQLSMVGWHRLRTGWMGFLDNVRQVIATCRLSRRSFVM